MSWFDVSAGLVGLLVLVVCFCGWKIQDLGDMNHCLRVDRDNYREAWLAVRDAVRAAGYEMEEAPTPPKYVLVKKATARK